MALYHRWETGEGQQIDVAVHDSAVYSTIHDNPAWNRERSVGQKRGDQPKSTARRQTSLWRCKDGYVSWTHGGSSRLSPSLPLIQWMESEGYTNDFLKTFDWHRPDFSRVYQQQLDLIEEPTATFFMAHTKAELLEGAAKRQVMLYPVATTADMLENPQLTARGFWVQVEHLELGATITYPGAFASVSQAPLRISRRAPLIGEHNQEIYEQELGISRERLVALKERGAI